MYKFIDLFCGIGAFHQALKNKGQCVFACDINPECRETYKKNYGIEPFSDITKLNINTIPEFDILCAGFPCQSFSNAGKKQSFSDQRGGMFDYILKIAEKFKPKYLFLENVKHIIKINNGEVMRYITENLDKIGYDTHTEVLSPHQFGIPQNRPRVYFVCCLKESKIVVNIPEIPIVNTFIFEKNTSEKYRIPKEIENVLDAWNEVINFVDVGESLTPTIMASEFHTLYTPEEFSELIQWKQDYITKNKRIYEKYKTNWDLWYNKHKQLLCKNKSYAKLEWQVGIKKENDSIFNYFIQIRQSGIRVKKTNYFPTLVAINQTSIYAKEKRYITPRECARLQSFPEDFNIHEKDNVAYKQFGNSINVTVLKHVINSVI